MRFMRDRSSEMPPNGALTWPSSEVPVPKGITGTRGFGAELHDFGHLGLGLGEKNGVGRFAFEPGERVGVLLAQRLPHGEAAAEARGQFGKERTFALRSRVCFRLGHDRSHGAIYKVLRGESLGFSASSDYRLTTDITAAKWQLAADSTKPCQMAFWYGSRSQRWNTTPMV